MNDKNNNGVDDVIETIVMIFAFVFMVTYSLVRNLLIASIISIVLSAIVYYVFKRVRLGSDLAQRRTHPDKVRNKERKHNAPSSNTDNVLVRHNIPVYLGDTNGKKDNIFLQLAKVYHIGIYGESGSGKTNIIYNILYDIVSGYSKEEIQVAIIDPKKFKYKPFSLAPHLSYPIGFDDDTISYLLRILSKELQNRLDLFDEIPIDYFCEGLEDYHRINEQLSLDLPKIPILIIVIDEAQEVVKDAENEEIITRIAKIGREVGIKLVCGTQRPTSEVPHSIQSQLKCKFVGTMVSSDEYNSANVPKEFHSQMTGKVGQFSHKTMNGKWVMIQTSKISRELLRRMLNDIGKGHIPKAWDSDAVSGDISGNIKWSGTQYQKKEIFVKWFLKRGIEDKPTTNEIIEVFSVSAPTARSAINSYYDYSLVRLKELE